MSAEPYNLAPYRAALEAVRDGVWIFDAAGQLCFGNRAAREFSPGELFGKPLRDVLPQAGAEFYEACERARRDGVAATVTHFHPARGVWLQSEITPHEGSVTIIARPLAGGAPEADSEKLLHRSILDSLPAHIAVLDSDGIIIAVNEPWRRFAREHSDGAAQLSEGADYLEVCRRASLADSPLAQEALDGIEAVLRGQRTSFELEYPCAAPGEERWLCMQVMRPAPAVGGALIVHSDVTERNRVQAALHDRETHLRLAMDAALAIAFEWDIVHDRVRRLHSAEETLPATGETFDCLADIARAAHPDDRARFHANVQAALQSGIYVSEYRIVRPDGSVRWLGENGRVEFDTAGQPLRLIGISQDITERKVAEEALGASEKFSHTVLESSPDCLKLLDHEGRLQFMNANGLCLMEVDDFAALQNKLWWELWPEESQNLVRSAVSAALRGQTASLQACCPTFKGTMKWWDVIVAPVPPEDGAITRVIAVSRDITQSKAAQAALERYRLLSENARDIVWIARPDGQIIEINQAAVQAYGYGYAELLQMNIAQLREASTLPQLAEHLREATTAGVQFETLHRRKDGTVFPVEVNAASAEIGGERLILSIVRDLSERKQIEAMLARERERLAIALRTGQLGAYEWRVGEDTIWWAPETYFLFGVTPETFTPTIENFSQLIHPDDRAAMWQKSEESIARREVFSHEYRIIRPDGEVRWLHNRSQIGFDATGRQAERVIGMATDITERREAEAALRAAHGTFRHLVEHSPFGIYVVDADFRLVQVSDGAQNVFKNVRPLLGRDFDEVLHCLWPEPFVSEALGHFRHTLATGETYHAPNTSERRADTGEDEAYDWKIERLVLPDGRFGVVCHFYDLSERQRYEGALRESETRLALGVQVAGLALAEIDYQSGLVHLSAEAAQLLDLGERSLTLARDAVRAALHPDDRREFEKRLAACLDPAGEGWFAMEGRIVRSDGTQRWLRIRKQVFFEGEGAVRAARRAMLAAIDITPEKEAAEAQRHSEERYRLLVEQMADGLFVADENGRYTDVNAAGAAMLGYTPAEICRLSIADVVAPEELSRVPHEITRLAGGAVSDSEWVFQRRDGSVFNGEIRSRQLPNGRLQAVLRDVTERKRAEDELRRHAERQALLLEISQLILTAQSGGAALTEAIFEKVRDALRADVCFNYRLDHASGLLHLVAQRGVPAERLAAAQTLQLGQAFCGWVAENKAPLLADAALICSDARGAFVHGMNVRAYACHPLLSAAGEMLGTLSFASTLRDSFSEGEAEFLQTICHFVALAWERAEAEAQLKRQVQLLDEAHDAIFAWEWNGGIVYWNQGAERLYGYSAAEALGQHPHAFLQTDAAEVATFRAALERDGVWIGELSHITKTKQRFDAASRMARTVEPGGRILVIEANRDITQRKAAEAALRESEARFRQLADAMPQLVWTARPDGAVDYYNQRVQEFQGFSRDESGSWTWAPVLHEDDMQATIEAWTRALATGEAYQIAHRVLRADGAYRWFLSRGIPARDENGAIIKWYGTATDIDDTKRVEAALRLSEDRFRHATEALRGVVYEWNAVDDSTFLSRGLFDLVGYSPDEVPLNSHWWRSLIHPDDLPGVNAMLQQVQREQAEFLSYEYRVLHRDGHYVWIWDNSRLTYGDDGQITHMIGCTVSVHERKRAEESLHFLAEAGLALAASLDHQSTVHNLARLCVPRFADSCVVYAMSGNAVAFEARHADPTRQSALEALAARNATLLPEGAAFLGELRAGRSLLLQDVDDANLRGIARDEAHFELYRQVGGHSVLLIPLRVAERFTGYIALTNAERRFDEFDLTLAEELARRASAVLEKARLFQEMQRAREVAEAANLAKDQFLSVASHELRTPLTPILGWVQILRSSDEAELKTHALDVLERNARAQVQLVDDILDVSRISTGKMRFDFQPLNLARVVSGAVESLLPTATAKKVRLLTTEEAGDYRSVGDAGRLQQVVWNLLSNAIKFTPAHGAVTLSLRRADSPLESGQRVEIEVRDSGVGIAPEFLPHVFERFRQADSSHTRRHGGLGLGLSIVKHIVEMHGGEIEASSIGEGQGAAFTVRLPLAPTDEVPAATDKAPAPAESSLLAGLRVLVVDDEPDARDFIQVALERAGARVLAEASADDALDALSAWQPHVLVSDVNMPTMSGHQFIERIRANPDTAIAALPALAFSACATDSDRRRSLEAGFTRHLDKPLPPDDLIKAVAELVRRAL